MLNAERGKISLTVVMPALNEEKNIVAAMENTLKAMDDLKVEGELIVVNDGSTDRTGELVEGMMKKDPRVGTIRHATPQGIGTSFWDGVNLSRCDAVTMLPGDNENDPWETLRYVDLLNHVDIIIPFTFNKFVRSFWRNMLSWIYRFIINATFGVNFNYTNGTVLYRKSILNELEYHSSGFFFQTDILIRSVKMGYLFAEVPYKLNIRKEGVSTAVTFPSFIKVVRGYLRLVRDIYYSKDLDKNRPFAKDTQTDIRNRE